MARGDLTDEQWDRLEPLLPPIPRSDRRGPGSPAGPRRDLVVGPGRVAVAGCARAVRAVGDGVLGFPAPADRRHLGPHPLPAAGRDRCRWNHRVGGVGRLEGLPGPPARCRGVHSSRGQGECGRSGGRAGRPRARPLARRADPRTPLEPVRRTLTDSRQEACDQGVWVVLAPGDGDSCAVAGGLEPAEGNAFEADTLDARRGQ